MKQKKPSLRAFSLIELSIVILIIGIIIAAITQGSRMVSEYKINTARTITQSSNVSSIAGLSLWLDPVMEGGVISATNNSSPQDGDKISAWMDLNPQSSQKINLSQNTSGNQPTYVRSGINGIPTIWFNNAHYLENSTIVPIPAGHQQYTIFVIWKQTNSSGVQVLLHQRGAQSCTIGDRAGFYTGGGSFYGWGCGSDTTIASYSANKNYSSIYRVDNSQANNVTTYLNGVKVGPVATVLNPIGATAFGVGWGNDDANTYYFRGYISEVIVFTRALKDQEIKDVRSYLTQKYGFNA